MIRRAVFISQLTEGEAGRTAADLSLHLSEKNECFVVVDNSPKADYLYGGNLVSLDSKNLLKKIYQLKQFKDDYAVVTMVSFATWPNLLNIYTRKKERVVISVRESLSSVDGGLFKEAEQYLMKQYYPKADRIVVPLESIKKELLAELKIDESKISVIYNPINIAKIRSMVQEKLEFDFRDIYAHPVVINTGKLTKGKGHRQLLKAFKKVKEEVPGAKLHLLGDGDMKGNLQQLVDDLDLENDVFFGGGDENPYRYLAKAAVAVFPSTHEEYPYDLCEAMACGVPVLASDCKKGPREILTADPEFRPVTGGLEEVKYGTLLPVCKEDLSNYIEDFTPEELILAQGMVKAVKEQDFYRKRATLALERVEEFNREKIMAMWDKLI
jgi:glycosyltransferase involved in cell wall biosynthesis